MPRTETIIRTLYTYDELSPKARATARDWFRECRAHFGDTLDFAESDICTIAGLLGFTLNEKAPLAYSIGYCQSDYAAFNGEYQYKPDVAKAVREYAPQDEKLHAIADDLDTLQAQHDNALKARCRSSHLGGQDVECQDAKSLDWNDLTADLHDELAALIRRFSDWAYWQLRDEDTAQNADECVADNIRANEYEFTEDGSRA